MAKAATMTSNEQSAVGRLWGRLVQLWGRTTGFLADVRNEMRKVTFPSRKEVQATTTVVIITVIIFGIYFFLIDQAMGSGIQWVLRRGK